MTVSIGLVGYGSWAKEAYVPALLDDGDVAIGAIAARTEATRRLASERFGEGTALFDDPFRLVREADVDAVMIGLPSELVSEVAIAAIEAGKHVFLEPPQPGDARVAGLLELAGRLDLVFHADMELRYNPVVGAVAQLLDDRLGPVLSVRVVQRCDWALTWDQDAVERGEMASELSTCYLDPIDALIDCRPRRVDVTGARPRFERAVEAGLALVEYDGAVGEWSFNLRGHESMSLRLEVAALEGDAEADMMTGRYRYRTGSSDWVEAEASPALPVYGFAGMRECVAAFLGAVRGECRSRTGPDVLGRVHAAATAFDESVRSGGPAEVEA
ncbi:MAG: Gfo/Idh/MocA family oxidoreductase [Chloroflexota bacterium]|nr:Gfo/Idh/MocA family oxidoreductase [Chloroflexota bacterium]MDE2942093.1 Gfo/Idh/MocA family oxidoreductase [Chloroflexota bacterium]MDE3268127.1 Gfo/Idh/MocA family oxidoreductase [Chloroflexota bacterium]